MKRGSAASTLAVCAAFCLPFASVPADAHARLIASQPAAGATVTAPGVIKVRFNEAIEGRLSALKLSFAGREVTAAVATATADPAALAIVPAAPLTAGVYQVSWSAVSQDGHRTHGAFIFTVK